MKTLVGSSEIGGTGSRPAVARTSSDLVDLGKLAAAEAGGRHFLLDILLLHHPADQVLILLLLARLLRARARLRPRLGGLPGA